MVPRWICQKMAGSTCSLNSRMLMRMSASLSAVATSVYLLSERKYTISSIVTRRVSPPCDAVTQRRYSRPLPSRRPAIFASSSSMSGGFELMRSRKRRTDCAILAVDSGFIT